MISIPTSHVLANNIVKTRRVVVIDVVGVELTNTCSWKQGQSIPWMGFLASMLIADAPRCYIHHWLDFLTNRLDDFRQKL